MNLKVFISSSRNIYFNLATEEYLISQYCKKNEIILYLWQNDKSVVIGRNQSASTECNLTFANENHINIGRRLSGGGAVFHDGGNLNYTFASSNELFSKKTFLSVIIDALNMIGLNASLSGRNDIEIDGKKVSGTAYYEGNYCSYLHGCLMIDVDIEMLEKVLTVDLGKMESKGIKSVRSRILNLREINRDIDIDIIKQNIIKAAEIGIQPDCVLNISADEIKVPDVLVEKYHSDNWVFGKNIPVTFRLSNRFLWGSCELLLHTVGNRIEQAKIFSDSLETDVFGTLLNAIENCELKRTQLLKVLKQVENDQESERRKTMVEDIGMLMLEGLNINE